jgi:predicted DNA-binding protein with PD1-like motif
MKYSQAGQGRMFVIKLEDGDIVHEVIENFAVQQSISAATGIRI